jgi:hypothetical protein
MAVAEANPTVITQDKMKSTCGTSRKVVNPPTALTQNGDEAHGGWAMQILPFAAFMVRRMLLVLKAIVFYPFRAVVVDFDNGKICVDSRRGKA